MKIDRILVMKLRVVRYLFRLVRQLMIQKGMNYHYINHIQFNGCNDFSLIAFPFQDSIAKLLKLLDGSV